MMRLEMQRQEGLIMNFAWSLVGNVKCYTDIPEKYKNEIKTGRQWALLGYVPCKESQGAFLWSNHFCNAKFAYFHRAEVRLAVAGELDSYFAIERERRNKRARERRAKRKTEREREEAIRMENEHLAEIEKAFYAGREKYISECRSASEKAVSFDLRTSEVIVIDTETTGLDPSRDELLQISILDGKDGTILFDSYVKPVLVTEWSEAMAINGITTEMVADAPEMVSLVPVINHIIRSAKRLIAYNAAFDVRFLEEFGIDFSSIERTDDLMQEFAVLYGDWNEYYQSFAWKSLEVCAAYFGYEWGEGKAHNSFEDCKATLYCYQQMNEPKYREIYDENIDLYYSGDSSESFMES